MIGSRSWGVVVVICASLLCAAASAQPATAPATQPATQPAKPTRNEGWVSGTIIGVDGKPMAAFQIRAERNEPMGMGGGGGGPAGPRRPKEVKTTTDEKGNFLFTDLQPDSEYILIAGSADLGWIYEPVTIEAGKEVKLGELKMVKI